MCSWDECEGCPRAFAKKVDAKKKAIASNDGWAELQFESLNNTCARSFEAVVDEWERQS